jgi:hypothetical protein
MANEAPHIDILQTVFPVVATERNDAGELARPDFFGTAFAVGRGVFMTAAHVVEAARQHGRVTLAGPTGERTPMGGAKVDRFEVWADYDIALLFCNAPATVMNLWLTTRVQVLTDLSSFGYPHAITRNNDQEHFAVLFRAYKGYVITSRGFDRLNGKPAVYEISCPFPEGLSGAPVLFNLGDNLAVAGVVIGVETVEYGGVSQSVGIAMIADEIAGLSSSTLGGTLGDRLAWDGATVMHGDQEPPSQSAPGVLPGA